MDIYMARNATTRNGLVPLWGRIILSWYDVILNVDEIFWHEAIVRRTTECVDMDVLQMENLENILKETVNTRI